MKLSLTALLFVFGEESQHAFRFEALAHEMAVEPSELPVVGNRPAAEASGERRGEQGVGVHVGKGGIDGFAGDRLVNPGTFDLQQHARPAAAAQRRLGPGNCAGDAAIVDGALGAKPGDGVLDVCGVVVFAGEALPHLRLGQLALRQQFQAVEIRPARCQTS